MGGELNRKMPYHAAMTNAEIARHFRELARLMELHGDNPFKIRSYTSAYNKLRKLDRPLAAMDEAELQQLEGVGKAIAAKITELVTSGKMATLEKWREQTPPGVRDMLGVSGFGPKKVRAVWEGLGVTTVGQLLYAINENRLVELKGFGAKTQESLRQKLEFFRRSRGRFLYRDLEPTARALVEQLRTEHPAARTEPTGALRRACPTLERITLLTSIAPALVAQTSGLDDVTTDGATLTATVDDYPVTIHCCTAADFGSKQFRHTGSPEFLRAFVDRHPATDFSGLAEESAVFARAGRPVLPPELREGAHALDYESAPELISPEDIRGVVHAHSTWSDGIHSLHQMAEASRERGYEYLVITDHSRAAFYANGLSAERVRQQWAEIDALNAELAPFRILKGTECDILADGSLDYDDALLAGFDLVIASVHSNLNMDEAKATARLLAAVANPRTDILGHPTGRLLLGRPGYPIDHRAVIDACAEHGVAIELNANPYRLDLDWTWLPYARERGVAISINPDAHAVAGIDDIRFGILAARKGGLTAADCLNARPLDKFPG